MFVNPVRGCPVLSLRCPDLTSPILTSPILRERVHLPVTRLELFLRTDPTQYGGIHVLRAQVLSVEYLENGRFVGARVDVVPPQRVRFTLWEVHLIVRKLLHHMLLLLLLMLLLMLLMLLCGVDGHRSWGFLFQLELFERSGELDLVLA